jgi:hypothetical protein
MRRGENASVLGVRTKDMQSIFEDERRGDGAFAPGRFAVGPKPALTASKILESALHFLAVFSWSAPILDSNAFSTPY